MHLAYVAPKYAPDVGGVERHVEELARRALAAGHRVDVLTQTTDASRPRHEDIQGIEVRRFAAVNGSEAYGVPVGLFGYLARHGGRYDLLHAHGYHALPALGALAVRHRPVVLTPHYHGGGHTRLADLAHRPYRLAGGRLVARADAIVCVSAAERRLLLRDFPAAAPRVRVIPNGVGARAIRAATPLPATAPTVLAVGRLAPYKRVDGLVRALEALPPPTRLVIVGDGPARADLEALARRSPAADRIALLGRVDDATLRRWLVTADVVASLSAHEAFGLVLLEGLAGGAAVVASDIPAHREVVGGRSDAVLVPADAGPAPVTAALERALAIGRGPREGIMDWDEVAARTLDLYAAIRATAV